MDLKAAFMAACLAPRKPTPPSLPSSSSLGSSTSNQTSLFSAGLSLSSDGLSEVAHATRLTEKYPNAYSDFGNKMPCIFKSGPLWPAFKGSGLEADADAVVREPRPVYGHKITPAWRTINSEITEMLQSRNVTWTAVHAFAYGNEGEVRSFCELIVIVGVEPSSLSYDDAFAAAKVVKEILTKAGFPEIETAFVELAAPIPFVALSG
ncbi:hypothetical protein FA95DRAFT_379677 [Auriscalpium vulgare]|uniref:Uncharacterized protein n=1 Tax=Auriscalpium vulgare TaxID=40419 RepID=A0ACB8S4U7_9AGAM|nr:hypothetical protein FA95DRAFT_379677 [Auriscalpium vulgare]